MLRWGSLRFLEAERLDTKLRITGSKQSGFVALPIFVLEQTLVELARRVARKLFTKVDRTRALHVRQMFAAMSDQLAFERLTGVGEVGRLNNRLDLFSDSLNR